MERFRRIALLLLLPSLLLLVVGCPKDEGPVDPGDGDIGPVKEGEIFGLQSGAFTISGEVTVPENKTLTLAAGTEVYFRDGASLVVKGEIQAVGMETDWITFTSVRSNPERGQWGGITLLEADDNSLFEYVRVAYGAKYDLLTDTTRYYYDDGGVQRAVPKFQVHRGGITIKHCSPTIRRSIIELGGYTGINVIGDSSPLIEFNTIVQNAFNGIHIEPDWALVDTTEGAIDPLEEMYNRIAQSRIYNNVIVENDDAGIRLPQDQVLYERGLIPEVMYNDIWNNASLAYVPPDWVSPSTPNYADVSTNSQVNPVFVDLEASDYNLHPCSGVIDSGDPAETDADGTRADMGAIPLYQGPYDLAKRLKTDNVYNKLNLEAGETYLVRCDVWVEDGDVLTIGPGAILAFEGLYSVYIYGGVEISGSQGNEVVFTSAMDDPQRGDWRQIVLEEASNESFINHAIIEYASMDDRSSPSPDTLGAISIIACAPELNNVTVRNSYYTGLHCFNGANPAIDRLVVDDVGVHGIVCELNSSPVFTRTTISDAGGYGIYLVNNSNPTIENLLMYNLGGSGFYVSGLSSPEVAFATVYGQRITDDGSVGERGAHGVHAVNYAKPVFMNSIFAYYEESAVLSEVSSRPDFQYSHLFSDVTIMLNDGNVDTTLVYTDEATFTNAANLNFTLPAGSPDMSRADDGGEIGAYGGNGM